RGCDGDGVVVTRWCGSRGGDGVVVMGDVVVMTLVG
ncbi:hypothetical protein Tco_0759550, partial [Tanacetum coccineum]